MQDPSPATNNSETTTPITVRAVHAINEVSVGRWNQLNSAAHGSFLTSYQMLNAFEISGSVTPGTGWQPHHLLIERGDELLGVVPLYAKGHSYGEFVFDFTWAEAHARHGLDYYPKWLCGVPFTPVSGPRLLCAPEHRALIAHALMKVVEQSGLASFHMLFAPDADQQALVRAGCTPRNHVQFHWFNQGWQSFDEFLSDVERDKRKKMRNERNRVARAGVETRVLHGTEISSADWAYFYQCYASTYTERGRTPYLNQAFFDIVGDDLAQHCVMSVATQDSTRVGSALCWYETREQKKYLYGRYWGSTTFIDCLHFEVAYYRMIEWAIEHDVDVFEGGAQGPHKMARGFLPVLTQSAHWLRDSRFQEAVAHANELERAELERWVEELGSPFRNQKAIG